MGSGSKSSKNKRRISINAANLVSSPLVGGQLRQSPASRDLSAFQTAAATTQFNLGPLEERKLPGIGNDVEMMSIGSQLRLDHLEEQPLRNRKNPRPPKSKKLATI
jgi:hypothetical protein